MNRPYLSIGEMQGLYVRFQGICKSKAPKSIKRLRFSNLITDIENIENTSIQDQRLSDLKQAAQEEIDKSWGESIG